METETGVLISSTFAITEDVAKIINHALLNEHTEDERRELINIILADMCWNCGGSDDRVCQCYLW